MKPRISTFILLGISLLSMVFAVGVLWQYYKQSKMQDMQKLDKDGVTQLINEFNTSHTPLFFLTIPNEFQKKYPKELIDPLAILPNPARYQREQMADLLKKEESCIAKKKSTDIHLKKLQMWFDYKCRKTKQLDESVWRTPPLIHPLGGSWAAWLFKNGFHGEDWLEKEKAYLHLLEYKYLTTAKSDPFSLVLTDLSPIDLQHLISGKSLIITNSYVLLTAVSMPNESMIHVFPKNIWLDFLKKRNLAVNQTITPKCDYTESSYCWEVQLEKRSKTDPLILLICMFLLITGLAGSLILTLWNKAKEKEGFLEKQQLVMQTLAHELRHPVTGLKLSVESIRPYYDALPEDVMSDFLRLATISERMSRLVKFSQQYLRLLSQDKQFVFRNDRIESFQSFLETTLENYEKKITLQTPEQDTACTLDGYWTSTCITNLVVNALTHGQQPILVSWVRKNNDLSISVQDSGNALLPPLKTLANPMIKSATSDGLGLGLRLVYRLAQLMKGSLELQNQPTKFTLTLKGVCHD